MPSTRWPRVSRPARADAAADEAPRHRCRAAGRRNCADRRRRSTWHELSTKRTVASTASRMTRRDCRIASRPCRIGLSTSRKTEVDHARANPSVPLPEGQFRRAACTIPRPARPPRSTRRRRRRSRPRCKATGWKLTDILVTHHHADHTGGIAELKQKHNCRVVAPRSEAAQIPAVDETVGEGDTVKVGALVGARDRDAGPHRSATSPTVFASRQARLRRRHAVLDRLRPRDRRQRRR